MQAVAYLRVSGTGQIDGTGFERQLDNCTRLAEQLGATIVQVFREEAVSGTTVVEDRPAFKSMTETLLDRGLTIVLIEGLDRLAREYRIQEHLLIYLAAKGFSLYAANTGECITDAMMADPMKKALVQIQGVFAELDKSLIVAKLRRGRQIQRSNVGRCEGQKPYGHYPGENVHLSYMRLLRSSGMLYRDIAARMNSEALRTRSGSTWHTGTVAKILKREGVTRACVENAPQALCTPTIPTLAGSLLPA